MTTLQNFVDGKYVESHADKALDVVEPATGITYAQAPISNAAEVHAAFESAARAFQVWGQSTPGERQLALLKIQCRWAMPKAQSVRICTNSFKVSTVRPRPFIKIASNDWKPGKMPTTHLAAGPTTA